MLAALRLTWLLLAVSVAACGTFPFPPPTLVPTDLHRPPPRSTEVSLTGSMLGPDPNWLGGPLLGGVTRTFANQLSLGLQAGPGYEGPVYGLSLAGPLAKRSSWTIDWVGGLGGTYQWGTRTICPDDPLITTNCPVEPITSVLRYFTFAPHAGVRAAWQASPRWTLGAALRLSDSRTIIISHVKGITNSHALWTELMLGAHFSPTPSLRLGVGLAGYLINFETNRPIVPAATVSASWTFGEKD